MPTEQIGRAISDVRLMHGVFDGPETEGGFSVLTGTAPVSLMGDYAAEVAAYTRGRGRLSLEAGGYTECHNPDAVIDSIGYDAERDTENPADSVFCAHGAGTVIPCRASSGGTSIWTRRRWRRSCCANSARSGGANTRPPS